MNRRSPEGESGRNRCLGLGNFPREGGLRLSMGLEDQAIMHMIAKRAPCMKSSLSTPGECSRKTYDLIEATEGRYGIDIQVYFPAAAEVEQMVNITGRTSFAPTWSCASSAAESAKLAASPRARGSSGMDLRSAPRPRPSRGAMRRFSSGTPLTASSKINPLAAWSEAQVWDYVKSNNIPITNSMTKGFPASAARAARGRCAKARTFARADGGGERRAQGVRASPEVGLGLGA